MSSSNSDSGTRKQKIPQPIPGYELIEKIGEGGMGAVYKARQKSMDRIVAIKILPKRLAREEEFKQRFFREARSAGQLSHGNIVSAIDASEAGGYCYLVMEYVEGESLADTLMREGALTEKRALEITLQIAEALSHAWDADIVHRDVKPENFLIAADGTAKLCDLGIAKAPSDAGLTQAGLAVGTPRYISPEQAQAKPDFDFRTDIYSLGASLFHMLCGEPPYDGPSGPAIMLKHITEPLPSLKEKAPHLTMGSVRLVEKMMAKNPDDRYLDAASLLDDIRRVRDGATVTAPKVKIARPSKARKRATTVRRRASTRRMAAVKVRKSHSSNGILVIVLVTVFLLLALLLLGRKKQPDTPPPPPQVLHKNPGVEAYVPPTDSPREQP